MCNQVPGSEILQYTATTGKMNVYEFHPRPVYYRGKLLHHMIWGWQMYNCMPCPLFACLMSLFGWLLVLRSVVQVAVLCLFCVTMVSTSILIWTVNSKCLLQFLFLLTQFHRVHKVVDASQRPHWRWEPGLYVSVLTHHQHAEVVPVYL